MKLRDNKKGMAMLLVLTSVVILSLIMVELNYNTRISSAIAGNYRDETAAYYLARSSVNVALLRIGLANVAKGVKLGGIGIPDDIINMIITIPFIFPPPMQLLTSTGKAEDADLGVKDMVDKIKTDTNIASVGYFDHNITSMDTALNLNEIALSESLASGFKEQMKLYYSARVQKDESFAHRWPVEKFERVINNIIDWIDQDMNSRNGGDENNAYQRKETPYRTRSYSIPTINELHMVDEMDDELFEFISPYISLYSGGSINVNHSTKEMWQTVDSRLTDEEIQALLEKITNEGGFKDIAELKTWIGKNTRIAAADFNSVNNIPLVFTDNNFKIVATGHSGKVSKKLTCYVSDTYKTLLLKGTAPEKPSSGTTTTTTKSTTSKPEIVFWEM